MEKAREKSIFVLSAADNDKGGVVFYSLLIKCKYILINLLTIKHTHIFVGVGSQKPSV